MMLNDYLEILNLQYELLLHLYKKSLDQYKRLNLLHIKQNLNQKDCFLQLLLTY